MNAKTLEAITRHGNALLAAFPNATEKSPVALCKKLRRIETAVSLITEQACNEPISQDLLEHETSMALIRAATILGLDRHGIALAGLFVNRDPRGYALKINDESDWFRTWQDEQRQAGRQTIHTDMGGYGILAPDLTSNE